jgi:hypothetical protein
MLDCRWSIDFYLMDLTTTLSEDMTRQPQAICSSRRLSIKPSVNSPQVDTLYTDFTVATSLGYVP